MPLSSPRFLPVTSTSIQSISLASMPFTFSSTRLRATGVGILMSNFWVGIFGSASIASTVLKAVMLTSSISSVGCLVVNF